MGRAVIGGLLVVVGCGRAPGPTQHASPTATGAAVTTDATDATDTGTATGTTTKGASQTATEMRATIGPATTARVPMASACAAGMVLVDGDYCTQLALICQKSWYANWNDKTICESFDEPSKCIGKKTHKRFCIDEYEYPNRKGERPRVMFKFGQAQRLCAAAGKRVCTESEWTTACEGPDYKPYPYGYVRDPKVCNGDRPYVEPKVIHRDTNGLPIYAFASKNPAIAGTELERLWQGVESGSQARCVSDYGVWDMPGNADELASSETPEPTSKFDNVTTGGPWLYGVRNQCRPKIYTHDEGFDYYYLSTRCCAEPDGAVTDPRAPKQIERGETWRP